MKSRLIVGSLLSFILAISVMGAASFSQEQQHHQESPKEWGFGDGINGAIATGGFMLLGWTIGKISTLGLKHQESQLKTEILKEVTALIEEEIHRNQEKNDLVVGRQFDAIMSELIALGKEIKGIDRKLDEAKATMEKRLAACESEIRRVDGNIDNVLPHVNHAIAAAFSPFGVTPDPVSVRKNPPSNPAFYPQNNDAIS
jgi:hypothetical protein